MRSKYVLMTSDNTASDDAIRATNVTKRILRNVNFRAKKSSVCALLGHNGAGKTTLVSVLVGLESINEQTKIETSGEVGFCPQFDFLWPQLTVREHLRLRLAFSSKSRRARNNDEEEENISSSEPILIQTLASRLSFCTHSVQKWRNTTNSGATTNLIATTTLNPDAHLETVLSPLSTGTCTSRTWSTTSRPIDGASSRAN